MGLLHSCFQNIVYSEDDIKLLLKEYSAFVGTIVAHQKKGKVFYLSIDVCNTCSNYKVKFNGLNRNIDEKISLTYKKQFDKEYIKLINALRTLQIEKKLACDEIILKNKKICTLLFLKTSVSDF